MKKSMLVAALLVAVAASSVMAGWQPVQFTYGNDTVFYHYSTKVGQDCFTLYKDNSSYRVYITLQGVGYEEFKQSVVKWSAGSKPSTDTELGYGSMTGCTLTQGSMFDANGNIKFEMYLADRFAGRNPKLSVVVMPHPTTNAHSGGSPGVTVTAANCDVSGVKVVYSPRPVDASGSQLAPNGTVVVSTGTVDDPYYPGLNYGNLGTIDVLGGLYGDCKIRGNCGTLLSQARTCTIKPGGTKKKVLQGGSLADSQIFVGGRIGTISARNGLVGTGGKDAKKRIVSGYADAATPKTYGSAASIGQVVVKRGWDKPCVVAGSENAGNFDSTAPTFYNGSIGLFRVNNKGDGTCSGQTGGVFTSATAPRVTGKMKSSVSGNTIFVQRWGKCDLADFVK